MNSGPFSAAYLSPRDLRHLVSKRLFFGRLAPIPPEVTDGSASPPPLVPGNGNGVVRDSTVLYAVGRYR